MLTGGKFHAVEKFCSLEGPEAESVVEGGGHDGIARLVHDETHNRSIVPVQRSERGRRGHIFVLLESCFPEREKP